MKKFLNLLFLIVIFCLLPIGISAKSFDYYVDESVKESGDGSEEDPFKSIKEALDEADKSDEIFISNGEYKESFTLNKSIKLFGESENGVVIIGSILMMDDTLIEDLMIKGSAGPIVVESGADAKVKNCTITNFSGIGINAKEGKGKLELIDSKITGTNGKGLYIQRGKEIEIRGNLISQNGEEGLDIRSKVDGVVINNDIVNNGESGIELIIGSADLDIKDNDIEGNGSSGIATQFYKDFDKKGNVNITNNDIAGNDKYGIDCNRPHGGSPGSSYWGDSIELKGNSIDSNDEGAISDYCKFIEAVDENEEEDNRIVETSKDQESEENEKEEIKNDEINNEDSNQNEELSEEEKIRIEQERQKEIEENKKKIEAIKTKFSDLEKDLSFVEKGINEIIDYNNTKLFFYGVNESKINELFKKIQGSEEKLNEISTMVRLAQIDEAEDEIVFKKKIDDEELKINRQKDYLQTKQSDFSLFIFFKKHLYLVIGIIILFLGGIVVLIYFLIKKKKTRKITKSKEKDKIKKKNKKKFPNFI